MSEQDKRRRRRTGTGRDGTSRRMFMVGGAAAVGAAAIGRARSAGKITDDQARLLDKITAASATGAASLSDVKHIVILMQENRSFDHYFGTLSGVRGLLRPERAPGASSTSTATSPASGSPRPATPSRSTCRTTRRPRTATTPTTSTTAGAASTTAGTAGRWTRSSPRTWRPTATPTARSPWATSPARELPFYHALADAFTICDGYHCSVLGPTDPNRLMAFSAWIDPAGVAGGPVITTASDRIGDDRQAQLGDDAGGAAEGRGELEGLRRPDRPPRPRRAAVLQELQRPVQPHQPRADRQGHHPDLPRHVPERREERRPAQRVVDPPAAGRVRAPGRAAGVGRVPGPADPEHPRLQPRGLGADRVHRRLRRERRLLRPRAAGRPGGRHRRGVPDRLAAQLGATASPARSASASAPRPWSSPRSARAATSTRALSITRQCCA